MRSFRLLCLFALLASPVVAQDTVKPPVVQVVDTPPKRDTAVTLPPIVRDTTAVSLPTEPPKDFGSLVVLLLPLLIGGATSGLMVLLGRWFPALALKADLTKWIVMTLVGGGFYLLMRVITGTFNTELWTMFYAGFTGILSTVSAGLAFNNGTNRATEKKQAVAAMKAKA